MIDRVSRAVLRHLFQKYLEGPSVVYAINRVTDLSHADPVEISNYMIEKNWIREVWVHQNNIVTCRITVHGMEEVNPSFIQTKVKNLVAGLMDGGGRKSLMEIFQHKIQDYVIALDIVYQLEKLGLVTLSYVEGSIHVALTEAGWKYTEKQGRTLLTLMAVV